MAALICALLVVFFLSSLLAGFVRWNSVRCVASFFQAEIEAVLDTVTASDHIGSLYAYQSHLAAGHRMTLPTHLCCQTSELPVFRQFKSRVESLGPQLGGDVTRFYVLLAQARRCFAELASSRLDEPEMIAAGLAEDIRLWKLVEVLGAQADTSLKKFISLPLGWHLSTMASKAFRIA